MRGIGRAGHREQGSTDDGQESRKAEGCRFLEAGLDEGPEEDAVEQTRRLRCSGSCPKRCGGTPDVGGTPEYGSQNRRRQDAQRQEASCKDARVVPAFPQQVREKAGQSVPIR